MTCEKCKYWTVDVSITKSRFGFCTLKKIQRGMTIVSFTNPKKIVLLLLEIIDLSIFEKRDKMMAPECSPYHNFYLIYGNG